MATPGTIEFPVRAMFMTSSKDPRRKVHADPMCRGLVRARTLIQRHPCCEICARELHEGVVVGPAANDFAVQ